MSIQKNRPSIHQQKPTKTNDFKNNPTMDQDYLYAASNRDTTGLTPTVAHDEYEAESYQEINHYLPPVIPTAPDAIPTHGGEELPQRSTQEIPDDTHDEIHLRAADGIHAEMRKDIE